MSQVEASGTPNHVITRGTFVAAALVGAMISAGVAVAFGGTLGVVVVLVVASGIGVLSMGHRVFWVLPVAAIGIAAVPHGAGADALLAWQFAGTSVQASEVFLVLGLLAVALLVRAEPLVLSRLDRRWVLAISMVFVVQACAAVWGIVSGNGVARVVQDVGPMLGYALGIGGLILGRHRAGVDLLSGGILFASTVAAGLTVAITSGLLLADALIAESGRAGIRNGVLWVLAVPMALELALSSHKSVSVRLAASMLLVVNLVGLAYSGTRALWLAVSVTLMYQAVIRLGTSKAHGQRRAIIVGICAGLLILGTAYFVGGGRQALQSSQRLSTFSNLRADSSLGTRFTNAAKANEAIVRSPLLGAGLGTRVPLYGVSGEMYESSGRYVDNVPQTVLLKSGVFGLISLSVLLVVAAMGVRRAATLTRHPLMVAAQASTPGVIVLMLSSAFLAVYIELAVFALVWGTAYGMLGDVRE